MLAHLNIYLSMCTYIYKESVCVSAKNERRPVAASAELHASCIDSTVHPKKLMCTSKKLLCTSLSTLLSTSLSTLCRLCGELYCTVLEVQCGVVPQPALHKFKLQVA